MPLTPGDIRWCERGLRNKLPIFGGWLRRHSAQKLAADGSPGSLHLLTKLGFANVDESVRQVARTAISNVQSIDSFQAVLSVFREIKDETLGKTISDCLMTMPRSLSDQLLAETWSLMPLDEGLWPLIERCDNKNTIDQLGKAWAENRNPRMSLWLASKQWVPSHPPLLRVLAALHSSKFDLLRESGTSVVEPLLACASDQDKAIKQRAHEVLSSLRNNKAIDFVCLRWWETRHEFYEWAIKNGGYVASSPVTARVGSALLCGRIEALARDGAEVVMPLLEAGRFTNAEVSTRAEAALISLKDAGAQDILCQQFIAHDDDIMRKIVLVGKHQPREDSARAVFFALTGQWARYDEVDFDHSLLRTAMSASPPSLRQRLLTALRESGRVSLLASVTGAGESRGRTTILSEDEAKFIIDMLREHKDWDRLWKMAFEVPFVWSVRIIEHLKDQSWRPADEDARTTCDELIKLVDAGLPDKSETLGKLMPIATCRARASVRGNVNTVAFAPHRPVIAIGTGHRRLALWNYNEALIEQSWNHFQRSVGSVAFTAAGTLIAAEKTTGERPCGVFIASGEDLIRAGEHGGSITGIEAVEDDHFITASRDGSVRIWDAGSRNVVNARDMNDWPRSLAVSPDGKWACASDSGPHLLALPKLDLTDTQQMFSAGISRETCFSPDSRAIIVGKNNGNVIAFDLSKKTRASGRKLNLEHLFPINGLTSLPKAGALVSADDGGLIKFTHWEQQTPLGSAECEGFRLTSIHTSPDEAFLVAGDSLNEITFWDIRGLELPALLSRPLALATPSHMSVAQAFQTEKKLSVKARRALRFLELLLRHRFRYEIEISEVASIMGGEFEIEIESA